MDVLVFHVPGPGLKIHWQMLSHAITYLSSSHRYNNCTDTSHDLVALLMENRPDWISLACSETTVNWHSSVNPQELYIRPALLISVSVASSRSVLVPHNSDVYSFLFQEKLTAAAGKH